MKPRAPRLLLGHLLTLLLLATCALAAESSGVIEGRVLDATTREPLIGASVVISGTTRGAATDSVGHFLIRNLSSGTYRLQVSTIGYEPLVRTDIIVAPGRQVELSILLQPAAVQMSEFVVEPTYFEKHTDTPVSSQSFSNEEIRRAPGGLEDVVRAVSVLPGVAQASAGRNDLIVRGGAPSENLYVVDGHTIPNINHFGTQGASGGPLSFVNLDFVRDVTFSTGGFGAPYGDRLSSVMDLQVEDGRTDRIGGKATLSASQFGLNTEGPLGRHGSFILSARRSYLDFIFKSAGFGFVPEYWDFLGKGTVELGRQDKLSLLNIGAIDRVRFFNNTADQRLDNSKILGSSQNQYFSGLSWQHLVHSGVLTTSLTRTYVDYKFLQTDTLQIPRFRSNSSEGETGLHSNLLLRIASGSDLTVGLEARSVMLDGDLLLPQFTTSFGDSLRTTSAAWKGRATKAAAYAQLAQKLGARFTLTAGGRLDYFDWIEHKLAVSPRASLSYALTSSSSVSASGGIYRQAPSYVWLSTNSKNRRLDFVQADQLVLGLEKRVRPDTRVRLEGYVKRYHNYAASLSRTYLVLANSGAGYGGSEEGFSSFGLDDLTSSGTGISRGVELFLQKRLSDVRCYGIASISYGKTDFKGLDGVSRPGLYDQRLIFNLSGGYQPNPRWEFAAKFRLGTGSPYTPYDAAGHQSVAQYNSRRLPVFHSADLRVDRRWNRAGWTLVTYVDLQNIYSHKNVSGYSWNPRLQQTEANRGIGILPSIGVSAEF